jgi:broad specificity phosphatase PhoE
MHTFYLVRHGQKDPSSGDPPLTELGHRQAELTGKHFTQFPIQKIVASPALRTQQTAQRIAEALDLSFETHPLLRERANWGDLREQSIEDFFAMWNRATADRDYQPEVGDSSRKAGQRIEQVVGTLTSQRDHQHIVLVTHGGVIADFLRNIFGDEQLKNLVFQFQHGTGYRIDECSITEISFREKTPSLKQLAITHHLFDIQQ